jgi:hypothetical protein
LVKTKLFPLPPVMSFRSSRTRIFGLVGLEAVSTGIGRINIQRKEMLLVGNMEYNEN